VRWAFHIARMDPIRNTCTILIRKPQSKLWLWRPMCSGR